MSWSPTARLLAYPWLVAGLLLTGLATGRPEVVAAVAPLMSVLLFGLLVSRRPRLAPPRVTLLPERVLEGETAAVRVELAIPRGLDALEVGLALPVDVQMHGTPNPGVLRRLTAHQAVTLQVRTLRWGAHDLGQVRVRAFDALRLWRLGARFRVGEATLRAYPRTEQLHGLVRPARTHVYAGNRVARVHGEGIEFADLRPHAPGDRPRSVNWRASARRGALWVNQRHPERNVDVILLLDTFTPVGPAGADSLAQMVRGSASLAGAWLRSHDRVGIIGFGGVLRWLEVGGGLRHAYRLVDALLDTQIVFSYAWKGIDVVPVRLLPPHALIVALTPLLDPRAVSALLELRGRGFDLAVLEMEAEAFLPSPGSESDALARRIWRLDREALRSRFMQAGAAVAAWVEGEALEPVVAEVEAWRRRARLRVR